jgi:hypothetical protein
MKIPLIWTLDSVFLPFEIQSCASVDAVFPRLWEIKFREEREKKEIAEGRFSRERSDALAQPRGLASPGSTEMGKFV